MQNVDVQIYFSQFKTFFNENPRELENLIGKGSPEEFYSEVYKKILENFNKGDELKLLMLFLRLIKWVIRKKNKSQKKYFKKLSLDLSV